jgi:dTDP-glucose 4,6-dehydratase
VRYFITGGAGFIGSNFIEQLLISSNETLEKVTIYDKLSYAANRRNLEQSLKDPRVSLVVGDICHKENLQAQMTDHDFVVHFAAESHVDRSIDDASAFVQTNVLGTFNVLEASRKVGIKTVIHVSTDEVYGSLNAGSADEQYPLQPNSPYAASKAASDLLARSYYVTHGLDVRTTRCCNNYGKYQYPEKMIPVFINKLKAGLKLPIYGDGRNVREWIHVSDHARGIQTVLENGSPGEIYNIGTGSHLSNNDLASQIIKIMALDENMKSYVTDRQGHDFRYSVDSRKIDSLGFERRINFDEGLKATIDWYTSNEGWWDTQGEMSEKWIL